MSFGFGGRRLSGVDLLGLGDLKVTAIDERHDGVTVDAEAIELDGVPVCECGRSSASPMLFTHTKAFETTGGQPGMVCLSILRLWFSS